MGKKTQKIEEITPKQKILNDITNLCVTIGDKSFLIRQTELELAAAYQKIDGLRVELGKLGVGPEVAK
jgi:hypothetical protein